jgi:hypothetical protein
MFLYVVLGKSGQIVGNAAYTESEAIALNEKVKGTGIVRLDMPWSDFEYKSTGGKGVSNYSEEDRKDKTTISIPRRIANDVKSFAAWLASE